MRERPKIDLGLTGYDEMFMNDQERAENRLPKIYDISLDEIDDFPDHPFMPTSLIIRQRFIWTEKSLQLRRLNP